MTAFRLFLVLLGVAVVGYTVVAAAQHGMGLFPIFVGDLVKFTWPGQFNLDFLCLLMLSGVWVAFRTNFTPAGILLGLVATVAGTPFLTGYLLVASYRARGDVAVLLLGASRASHVRR